MSRGQKPRTPRYFPQMKCRARRRQRVRVGIWRAEGHMIMFDGPLRDYRKWWRQAWGGGVR